MRETLRLTLVGLVFVSALPPVLAQTGIPWLYSLPEAQQIAQQEQRLLLIHFFSDTCPPCRRLEQVVFPNQDVYRAMAMNYIPVKINGERARDIARQFQVDRWPTDVIADAQGRVLYKTVSPQDPARYVQLLNAVASDFRAGSPPVQVAGRMPLQGEPPAGYAFAAYDNRSDARPPALSPPAPMSDQGWQQYGPRSADPYATQVTAATDAGSIPSPYSGAPAPREQINPYVSRPAASSTVSGAPQGDGYDPRSNWSPSQAMDGGGPYASANPAGSPPADSYVPTRPAWQEERFASERRAPTAPDVPATANAPTGAPTAMDGYCPVTLLEQERWVKGDPRWGAVHRGRTYMFLSQQHQQRFLSAPDRYSPVLSGFDAASYVDRGELVPGLRAHGMWFRGKIYLFATEESLNRFSQAPEFYAQRTYEIMMAAGRN
jgi:protein disulfide-isomerase